MPTYRRLLAPLVAGLALAGLAAAPAGADHSWVEYHWARTSNPFTLKLGDNVSIKWDAYLATTSSDWSQSSVLNTTIVAGSTTPKKCSPVAGRVEVCNSTYGYRGWLGVAQIWISNGEHITQGTVKLNDSYFNTATYNTPAWRNMVMCQEVGHTLGLDHQDETFDNPNLGTCMDYTNSPSSNQQPNQHDYDELVTIYGHLDSSSTIASSPTSPSPAGAGNSQADWGRAVRYSSDGRPILFERELGNGQRLFTFVVWAL